jgi:ribosomal-protein-serine acetyltransferase
MTITIDDSTKLEMTSIKHSPFLFDAINKNRAHLSEFLPWVKNMQSINDFDNYIKNCELLYEEKKEVSFVIILNENPVGRIGLHHLNLQNKIAAIGYWLTKEAQGKGIIHQSCKKLIDYGFNELGLNRIEIKCASENYKSQAIPEKFNFQKEGIMRQAEFVNETFLDIILYSILKNEWTEKTTNL